jgi:hypothetical protein
MVNYYTSKQVNILGTRPANFVLLSCDFDLQQSDFKGEGFEFSIGVTLIPNQL